MLAGWHKQSPHFLIFLVFLMGVLASACGMSNESLNPKTNQSQTPNLHTELVQAEQKLNSLGLTFNSSGTGFFLNPQSTLLSDPLKVREAVLRLNQYSQIAVRIINADLSYLEKLEILKRRKAALALSFALNGGRSPN